jgi:acyl carrier protein
MTKTMNTHPTAESHIDADEIHAVVANSLGIDCGQLTATTTLAGDLGVDSIDLLALAIDLEVAFDVTICDRAFRCIRTVGDTILFVTDALDTRDVGPNMGRDGP